jgi:hypothetical protein
MMLKINYGDTNYGICMLQIIKFMIRLFVLFGMTFVGAELALPLIARGCLPLSLGHLVIEETILSLQMKG